ncbi:hypothetical protein LJK88_11985 [Paenibacillus sp. P26]|nr:hypothetical protein LJK88_11985 [Paenibacillus sp. P26]UUZ89507.1 hypothetical protein LJK87_25700 [Paenibacillus sp. P25]
MSSVAWSPQLQQAVRILKATTPAEIPAVIRSMNLTTEEKESLVAAFRKPLEFKFKPNDWWE